MTRYYDHLNHCINMRASIVDTKIIKKKMKLDEMDFYVYQQLIQATNEVVNSLLQIDWVVLGRLNTETKPKNAICYPWAAFNNITKLLLCPIFQNKGRMD